MKTKAKIMNDMTEDYYTNTPEDAQNFAQHYSDEPHNDWVDEEDIEDDYEDECNCSDPGCPCGGRKSGGIQS